MSASASAGSVGAGPVGTVGAARVDSRRAAKAPRPAGVRSLAKFLRIGVVVALGLVWLAPLYLVVVNALRPSTAYTGEHLWTPSGSFSLFSNFSIGLNAGSLGPSVWVSLLYSLIAPAIAAVIGAMAGYAITVLRIRHGFSWFMVIYGGTMFPAQMLLVPLFFGYANLRLYDSRIGMVLIYVAIDVPLAAFVMRNFFLSTARSVYESALADGANPWTIFWRIYLPMCRVALIAVFILEFTFVWNDLLFGLVLSHSSGVRPLMTTLATLSNPYAGVTVPVILSSGLIVSLPTVVLFLATQRLFAKGLTLAQI
ncbi:MAG TPA: carbohydrate ABC transporter permease [Actinocrinis sp.]|jgi:multiple sugar transport system permease protein